MPILLLLQQLLLSDYGGNNGSFLVNKLKMFVQFTQKPLRGNVHLRFLHQVGRTPRDTREDTHLGLMSVSKSSKYQSDAEIQTGVGELSQQTKCVCLREEDKKIREVICIQEIREYNEQADWWSAVSPCL